VARQLVFDHRTADLSEADRGLCDFAVKLTLTPGAADERDVQRLREHGFDDEAISVAAQVIGYFNYINRVADGLGVDDEAWMTPSREEWLGAKGRAYGGGA
jgi:uncharacterized peroxidase-related enzyme